MSIPAGLPVYRGWRALDNDETIQSNDRLVDMMNDRSKLDGPASGKPPTQSVGYSVRKHFGIFWTHWPYRKTDGSDGIKRQLVGTSKFSDPLPLP